MYTDSGLPFSGSCPQSKHASHAGAEQAQPRGVSQTIRYMQALKDRPMHGMTDREASNVLGLERSTINARRVPLVKAGLVKSEGFRPGASGIKNCVWVLA